MPYDILIATNGSCIDLKFFEDVKFEGRLSFQLSIDGMRQAHDRRRGSGSFDKAVSNGSALSKMGISVSISMAIGEDNYTDVLDVINLSFADEVKLLPVANSGAADSKIGGASCGSYEEAMTTILKREISSAPPSSELFPHELAISFDGNVYPSMVAQDMGVLCVGNINEKSLDTITDEIHNLNPYGIMDFRAAPTPACDNCDVASICSRGCRIRAYKAFGSLSAPDPLCCKLYGISFNTRSIGDVFWGEIVPRIATERLILRRWDYADTVILARSLNDKATAHDYGTPYPYTEQDALYFIDDAIRYQKPKFAIMDKVDREIIGGCGIHQDGQTASANIWIRSDKRKMGFAKEAGKALLKFGFEALGITSFKNYCFSDNNASRKLQESVGSIALLDEQQIDAETGRIRECLTITQDQLA